MFDLEQAIAEWRRQMLSAGIRNREALELESHLRAENEERIRSGLHPQQAFETAVEQIGQPEPLNMEFKKVDTESRNRPLTWAALSLFVISFFFQLVALRLAGNAPKFHC